MNSENDRYEAVYYDLWYDDIHVVWSSGLPCGYWVESLGVSGKPYTSEYSPGLPPYWVFVGDL